MADRRHHKRYQLGHPWEARFEFTDDAVIEFSDGYLWALCGCPVTTGEVLNVQLSETGRNVSARVAECGPIEIGGEVRHRLRLELVELAGSSPLSAETTSTE